MNLREITKKVGRDIGLNLPAVQLFTKQLLLALHHFRECGVLHADIKPDNILINDRNNAVKVRHPAFQVYITEITISYTIATLIFSTPHPLTPLQIGCPL